MVDATRIGWAKNALLSRSMNARNSSWVIGLGSCDSAGAKARANGDIDLMWKMFVVSVV